MTLSAGSEVTTWIAIGVIALGTIAFRLSSFELFHKVDELPPWAENVLTLIPAAVIAAILVPEFVIIGDQLRLDIGNDRILSGLLAGIVAWKTEHIVATVTVGMIALWVLSSF